MIAYELVASGSGVGGFSGPNFLLRNPRKMMCLKIAGVSNLFDECLLVAYK